MIAARVAAELNKDSDIEAVTVKGRFLELSVIADGQQVVNTNPLWYPLPSHVVEKAKARLMEKEKRRLE